MELKRRSRMNRRYIESRSSSSSIVTSSSDIYVKVKWAGEHNEVFLRMLVVGRLDENVFLTGGRGAHPRSDGSRRRRERRPPAPMQKLTLATTIQVYSRGTWHNELISMLEHKEDKHARSSSINAFFSAFTPCQGISRSRKWI